MNAREHIICVQLYHKNKIHYYGNKAKKEPFTVGLFQGYIIDASYKLTKLHIHRAVDRAERPWGKISRAKHTSTFNGCGQLITALKSTCSHMSNCFFHPSLKVLTIESMQRKYMSGAEKRKKKKHHDDAAWRKVKTEKAAWIPFSEI